MTHASSADPSPDESGREVRAPLPHQHRWVLAGGALAIVLGLGATAHAVFSPAIRQHYADSPDSVDITRCAELATAADALQWWVGPWIQSSSPYYRPLSSIAFWLEHKAFGSNYLGHAIISWLLHGLICLCIYRIGIALLGGELKHRVVLSAVAVVLFNVRLGPLGPGWLPAPIAYGVVAWWPGQTDQLSLLFSLSSLLVFDAWLRGLNRNALWGASALWLVALLFKEMAIVLPLVAGCLILYRRGRDSLRLWRHDGGDGSPRRFQPGLLWSVALPGVLLAAAYLGLRAMLLPQAWGPQVRSPGYFLIKAAWFSAARPWGLVDARGPWIVVVAAFLAACIYVYARLPRRPSPVWLVLTMVVGAGVLIQLMTGNFAFIAVPGEVAAMGTMTICILGLVAFLHVRGGPTLPLLGMVAAVHLPILHVQGPHYLYWPAAFWSLLNTSILHYAWQRKVAGTLQWGRGPL